MFGRQSLKELIRSNHEEIVRSMDETREFNREILLRNEKVYTRVIAEMEENSRRIDENIARTRENTERTGANTQALLKLLDRYFEEPGDQPA